MPHVQVTIAGRSYRMACGEGEEQHLESLASAFDARISEMRGAFGEIGDMRLHVMAALMTADELAETRRRIESLEAELGAMRAVATANIDRTDKSERHLAEMLDRSARRLESLAARFGPEGRDGA